MGAESSVQRDGKSQEAEDASATTATAPGEEEVRVQQGEENSPDTKSLQKNGQISSMSSLNGHSEENTLAEVGQPDGVSVAQKEEAPETMDTIQDEVAPQVNGEKVEKESSDANDISPAEEKAAEEKPGETNEVGFKKIFRFVGFKFTLKKDKSEEKDPVKLLTIKDKDGDAVDEAVKEEEAANVEEKSTVEEKEADTATEADVSKDAAKTENTEEQTEPAGESEEGAPKEEKAEKEEETTAAQEVISPFRKIFSGGLFSNLRKKASIKKTKEEEEVKEETEAKAEEAEATGEEVKAETKEEAKEEEAKAEAKEEAAPTLEEDKPKEEGTTEEAAVELTPEVATEGEVTAEASAPETNTTDEPKQDEDKAALEVSSEAEMLSSQEKAKPHGSPLKKLFTGAGLKKLSTKKQKVKKDAETKVTESGEQAELQISTDSTEAPKPESGPSSPEDSGEHVITVEVTEKESSQETEGEVTSDGEKKKEGIIAWSSFKKLVTPKRRVKRPSESDDEATAEKPAKSATLSSTESATLADKSSEEETKDEKTAEEEPKTEATEKLTSSTEEKKKMDTSVSWEALMCMGGPKKRTRKTSDSDDDETKVEEVPPAAASEGDEEVKIEAAVVTSQTSENEGEVLSSPEPVSPPASAWDTLKRMVSLKRTKSEEKPDEGAEQVLSDSEAPKEESSFFLKKFFPGRRKKKAEKQASTELGSGEEDSDTPAVVPLSEYDEPTEAELEKPEEAAAVQTKATAEERSPSWISAAVEDDKLDQLSDIPEEVESAATPKSVDTDIADDEEQTPVSPKPTTTGRRLSTAEVKPLAPATSSETSALPKGPETGNADELRQGIEAQNTEIAAETSVAVENVPVEIATETSEFEPQTETADVKTNAILEVHAREEAMAICTGLGTKEIAKVTLEKPVSPITESVTVVRDACAAEVSVEEKPATSEEATMSEDPVLEAQIHQIDTTELEPLVEKTPNSIADIQVATESIEPQVEKVGVVSTEVEGSEVVQPPTAGENSPKATFIDAIIATSEAAVCTQSVEVSELTVETKEVKMEMEQLVATEENTPAEEVVQVVTKEITSTISDSTMTTTKETEPEIPVTLPSEIVPVIAETVVLVAPVSPEDVSTTEPVFVENVSVTEVVADEFVESEISVAVEQASEKDAEGETIESQSMVIAKNVIQEAMDKVSEDEPEKPSSPSSTVPTPDQAIATVEKDVEVESETPVITDTPAPIVCEKSPKALHVAMEVTDTIPIEITGCIEGSQEEESKEDVEVKVSEEAAAEEEQKEVKEESQKDESEQSNEDAVDEEKVNHAETTEEETQSKTPELHIPVQVVLQMAEVLEEPTVEEEAAVEFDSNGPVDLPVQDEIKTNGETTEEQVSQRLSTLTEEPHEAAAGAESQPEEEMPSGKCAEVMAQVIEVIEEAVKEIEPVSTEITATS